jgi:hypothetical protein
MFHKSQRCTLEAIVTQAIAVIIALAGSDFERSRLEQFGRLNLLSTSADVRHPLTH